MKNGNWLDITAQDVRDVVHIPSISGQLRALGFLSGLSSEGTRASLAWRKWFLGIATKKDLEPFVNRLTITPAGSARVSGSILLLGLIGIGRDVACERCGVGYDLISHGRTMLEADHIVSWEKTRDNRASNLRILCGWCHKLQETGTAASLYGFREELIAGQALA